MKWTQEQITELKNLCYKGVSNADLAKHFKVPVTEIYAKRSQHKITKEKCSSGVPEKNKKQEFIINSLAPMLFKANPDIGALKYHKTASGNEDVEVTMRNGATYHISVTADNLIATAADVINFMKSK